VARSGRSGCSGRSLTETSGCTSGDKQVAPDRGQHTCFAVIAVLGSQCSHTIEIRPERRSAFAGIELAPAAPSAGKQARRSIPAKRSTAAAPARHEIGDERVCSAALVVCCFVAGTGISTTGGLLLTSRRTSGRRTAFVSGGSRRPGHAAAAGVAVGVRLDNPLSLAIVLAMVIVLFGAKRIPTSGGRSARACAAFKDSITGKADICPTPSLSSGVLGRAVKEESPVRVTGLSGTGSLTVSESRRPEAVGLAGARRRTRRARRARSAPAVLPG